SAHNDYASRAPQRRDRFGKSGRDTRCAFRSDIVPAVACKPRHRHQELLALVRQLSIIERQTIHRGSFTSVKGFNAKIRAFTTGWNDLISEYHLPAVLLAAT
ncbi:MAG: hypothetical protein QOE89_3293, partial [Pseudonocardiales bacterium]|nr:hypothetical protein [Pseudonocardiales bacterium]